MRILPLLLILLSTLAACTQYSNSLNFGPADNTTTAVSMVAVLASPERFDGLCLRLEGVLQLEFEGDSLCLDPGSRTFGATKNCLWVDLDNSLDAAYNELSRFNGRYVLLEGEFRMNDHGHLGLFSGALGDVTRVLVLERYR